MPIFTVLYTTTGHEESRLVTNRYGRFPTKSAADIWLARNPCRDGRVVPEAEIKRKDSLS